MKRAMIFLAVFAILATGAVSASADSLARDAMVTYSGTTAFTRLTSMERQACVDWLVHGGEMSEKCSKAVMKLVTYDPDAVTSEQRQALIAEASGHSSAASYPEYAPAPSNPPQIVKQEDNTGKYIAVGVLGVIAGMVIHNNVGGSRRSESSCRPAPTRHYSHVHYHHHVSHPPVKYHQPTRQVCRPITRRPHCR